MHTFGWFLRDILVSNLASNSKNSGAVTNYRVIMVVEYPGWVDLDLRCSTILLGH